VHHGYARQDHDFPLYAIVLADEHEDEHFIGDDAGMVTDTDDPNFGADCLSVIWEHNYQVLCYAEHPDVTTYIYEVAKSVIFTGEEELAGAGVIHLHSSGMDLAPDPRYIPEHLFVRQLNLQIKREFLRVVRSSRLGKAFKVSGIHVDKSGSPSEVTVNTNITTYSPSDGET